MRHPREPIASYSHAAGAIFFIAGTAYLVALARGSIMLSLALVVYGLAAVFLFASSALYHAFKTGENESSVLRKLDHLAIFFMIAGTYTPVCYAYLDGGWFAGIIIAQWGLVLFGLFFKLLYLSAPRHLSTGIYVLMGWIVVIPMHKLYAVMPGEILTLIAAGGVSYTVGAVIYAIKRPNPRPGVFGFHEMFHLFILAGALLHFAAVAHIARLNG